jgi:hypothetical protein
MQDEFRRKDAPQSLLGERDVVRCANVRGSGRVHKQGMKAEHLLKKMTVYFCVACEMVVLANTMLAFGTGAFRAVGALAHF